VVHSALPLLSVECPSAGKRATEKANRRSNREKEGTPKWRAGVSFSFVHAYWRPKFRCRVRATTWN
jgi:hypothetical protein